jgi:hypothetical protein
MAGDRLFDLFGHPVGVRPFCSGETVYQVVGPIGLVIATDFVKLLTRIAHDFAGFADIAQFVRQFQQRQLPSCYLQVRGHVDFPRVR